MIDSDCNIGLIFLFLYLEKNLPCDVYVGRVEVHVYIGVLFIV